VKSSKILTKVIIFKAWDTWPYPKLKNYELSKLPNWRKSFENRSFWAIFHKKISKRKKITTTKTCRILCFTSVLKKKKCVAYPQEDFLFTKLLTSLRISLQNYCKKDFQFHTESKFIYTKYKIFFTWLIWISRFWALMTLGCISDPIKYTFFSSV
jgi:hypothetical protein